jgi:hypothetical protein
MTHQGGATWRFDGARGGLESPKLLSGLRAGPRASVLLADPGRYVGRFQGPVHDSGQVILD